jgi:hypothetical protein
MKVLEIKNNLYQTIGITLNDGTELNIPKRSKSYINKDLAYFPQLLNMVKKEKIKIKELDK